MKKHIIKKINLFALLFFIFFSCINSSPKAEAASYNIANALNVSYSGDNLFNATNLAPGNEIVKTITVTNNGKYPHSFSIATSGASGTLANVLEISPRINGVIVWTKTISQIAINPDTTIIVPNIDPDQSIDIDLIAKLPSSVGNDVMNTNISNFSFYVGNESTDTPEDEILGARNIRMNFFGSSDSESTTTSPSASPTVSPSASSSPVLKESSEVKGAEDEVKKSFPWWIIILLIIVGTSYWYYTKDNKEDNKKTDKK